MTAHARTNSLFVIVGMISQNPNHFMRWNGIQHASLDFTRKEGMLFRQDEAPFFENCACAPAYNGLPGMTYEWFPCRLTSFYGYRILKF